MKKILFIILCSNFLLASSLENKIKKYLDRNLKNAVKYEFEVTNEPNNKNYVLDEEREFLRKGRFAYLPIKMLDKQNNTHNSYLTLRLKIFAKVLVSLKKIERGENISSVTEKIVDITSLRGNPILNKNNISNKIAKLNISEGKILFGEMLEEKPDINIGDHISAIAVNGVVQITTAAYARSKGNIGDIIQIRTKDNKVLKGKILDQNRVEIYE